jgi:hypothetical protein
MTVKFIFTSKVLVRYYAYHLCLSIEYKIEKYMYCVG